MYYIPAVDTPAVRLSREDFDAMRAVPNIGLTAKLPSVLPVWVGMEMIFAESLLPPKYVRGTACEVVGLGRAEESVLLRAAILSPRNVAPFSTTCPTAFTSPP